MAALVVALIVLVAELVDLVGAVPAGAQEIKPPLTVDGPGPCRRIGGDWLPPGYCELTGPLRVAPDDDLVLAVGAFLLGPIEVEGRLEVRGEASLVFFFGELVNRGRLVVSAGGVAYLAAPAVSPGAVDVSGGGRMEILSDSGALTTTGRFDVARDGRLDVYGAFDSQGRTTNLGVMAVWCSGSLVGPPPVGVAAQVQDCRPPEVSLVSRTPADASGWNPGSVTVVWACTDGESGVVTERVTAVLSGDGAEQSAFGVCTDLAGNTAAGVVTGINIERPAPRARRRPASPVVVHLEPAVPAPPPPAPPAPPTPLVPAPGGAPIGPLELSLPGPSITDPVSSPDPPPAPIGPPAPSATTAPGGATTDPSPAPSTSTSTSTSTPLAVTSTPSASSPATPASTLTTPTTVASTIVTPSTAAPVATGGSAAAPPPTGATASTTTGVTVGVVTTTTTRGVTSAASPTGSSPAPPPATDGPPTPTTVGSTPAGAGSGPSVVSTKVLRRRPIRHHRRTGGSVPPG